ncbi:hypothetical protein NW754_011948 [Fusarium falciforme]|uniref:NAD(P)-binding domain-containing protein n=1 Tax=Fusarium falciforme TaxID=195108 RepID=A0A9W8V0K3_9HYPO|nr:hypothetical protein NW754_011948 [Fusarium falciforme]KAJ4187105.1 hypothetical protein NW755_007199 [Fusarium falciforme]KAJ4232916.1 hypothetical protein NW757_013764 [Fusarium falciforme]
MSAITKVAVVGASGNLGPLVIKALLEAGFEVTVVTRQESKATFPSSVVIKRVDISSVESVTEAVKGQDAIVSTIATEATTAQQVFIDAAIAAHVRRFIPSEFGSNTREARDTKFGRFVAPKIAVGLENGFFGFDLKKKTCTLFDSGDEPFSGTNLTFIGKCVAASLKKPEETSNKFLTVASFTTTQNEVLRVIEEETGSKFAVTHVRTSDLEKIADEKIARNDPSAFVELLLQYVFADGAKQAAMENAATTVLGLKEESLTTTVKAVIDTLL